jgi:hypothetical protein
MNQQGRNSDRLGREQVIDSLLLPEGVVAGMGKQFAPETRLLKPA